MSENRENGDWTPDTWADHLSHNTNDRDPMDAYKDMVEAEDAERARNELIESGRLGDVQHGKDYPGSLMLDCAAVEATPALRSVFSDFNNIFGDAQKEQNCGGHYSRLAVGKQP